MKMNLKGRNFLTLKDFTPDEITYLVDLAADLKDKKKKGTYLQMYESYQDKEKKQPRSRNIESFGYVSDLISNEIPDPVSYYQKYVEKKNREYADFVQQGFL